MKYEYNESLKHKLAKEILFKWLSDANGENGNNRNTWCKFAQFYWKPNYVLMEMIVQEKDCDFYFEGDNGRISADSKNLYHNKMLPNLCKIIFVPDITVFSCGSPSFIFEITHTNGLTKEKAKKMKDKFRTVRIAEVFAEDILKLSSTEIPSEINCREW